MPLFQYIGQPQANWDFAQNPDDATYEAVVAAPMSSKKATSAPSEESK
jgi:hypothetical protein